MKKSLTKLEADLLADEFTDSPPRYPGDDKQFNAMYDSHCLLQVRIAELEVEEVKNMDDFARATDLAVKRGAQVTELEKALVMCAIPYEAILADKPSRKWIAPSIWKDMTMAVGTARAVLIKGGDRPIGDDNLDTGYIAAWHLMKETLGTAVQGCYDCKRSYGDEYGFPDLVVPHDVWKVISPTKDEGGLLCPSCICKRLWEHGYEDVLATFRSGPCAAAPPKGDTET